MGDVSGGFCKRWVGVDSRALVKPGKAFELALRRRGVDTLAQHGHIKTGALHLHQLVDQHVTCGAQFARKAQTAAQQEGLAVGAAVSEFGELQVNAGHAAQIEGARIGVVGQCDDRGRFDGLVFVRGDDFHGRFLL